MVKFNPPHNRDAQTSVRAIVALNRVSAINLCSRFLATVQVLQEYDILRSLPSDVPVPKAVYASSANDEVIVGRAFIIMKFVPVCKWCVGHSILSKVSKKLCLHT